MIWRVQQCPAFLTARRSRQRVFRQAKIDLLEELRMFDCDGRSGNNLADALIEGWVPDAFQ